MGFGLTGLAVMVVLGAVTYGLARSYLLSEREETAKAQAFVNARLARNVLGVDEPDVGGFLGSIGGTTSSAAALRHNGEWFTSSVAVDTGALPQDLLSAATSGHAAHQRYRDAGGSAHLAVAIPVGTLDALYVEQFPLADLEQSLLLLRRSLLLGIVFGVLAAAAVGALAATRVVRPLRPVADAAARIAAGDLDTRLEPVRDADIRRLIDAFNDMATALQERIDREARFAADVSHELRSPLAAMTAAMNVIDRRRNDLPDHVVAALTVLHSKVETFERMVVELLDIARIDSGTASLEARPVELTTFLQHVGEVHGAPDVPIEVAADAPTVIVADSRRLAQVVGNLYDNAARYAGGVSRVTVNQGDDSEVEIAVEDRGPGVPPHERAAIFGRFARGQVGHSTGVTGGTGLGLAIVEEHLRLHGGRAWVEDADGGGARFVIRLPVREP